MMSHFKARLLSVALNVWKGKGREFDDGRMISDWKINTCIFVQKQLVVNSFLVDCFQKLPGHGQAS